MRPINKLLADAVRSCWVALLFFVVVPRASGQRLSSTDYSETLEIVCYHFDAWQLFQMLGWEESFDRSLLWKNHVKSVVLETFKKQEIGSVNGVKTADGKVVVSFDEKGRLKSIWTFRAYPWLDQCYKYVDDAKGRTVLRYAYSLPDSSQLRSYKYAYDAYDRLKAVTVLPEDVPKINFSYNEQGLLSQVDMWLSHESVDRYSFDSALRPVKVERICHSFVRSACDSTYRTRYVYDSTGRLRFLCHTEAQDLSANTGYVFKYDSAGNATQGSFFDSDANGLNSCFCSTGECESTPEYVYKYNSLGLPMAKISRRYEDSILLDYEFYR